MNKLKLAIAYLINAIKKTYYAAAFSFSVITSEVSYGRRMDGGLGVKTSNLRATDSQSPEPSANVGSAIADEGIAIRTKGQSNHATSNAPNYSCDGLFGFGDFIDGFGSPDGYESSTAPATASQDIQTRDAAHQEIQRDRAWDELEPCERQATILTALWQKQVESEYHELFSVHDVIELCDRADMDWSGTFDDLMSLKNKSKVTVFEVHDKHGKVFNGFYWGLR